MLLCLAHLKALVLDEVDRKELLLVQKKLRPTLIRPEESDCGGWTRKGSVRTLGIPAFDDFETPTSGIADLEEVKENQCGHGVSVLAEVYSEGRGEGGILLQCSKLSGKTACILSGVRSLSA